MRTLRSLGTTISSTPLLVSVCPIRQRRPSSTPKSSIEVPCNDFKVTTTSWSLVLASKSAIFWVSAARVAGSRILASSTTRPLSAGRTSASAGTAASQSKVPKNSARLAHGPRGRSRLPAGGERLLCRVTSGRVRGRGEGGAGGDGGMRIRLLEALEGFRIFDAVRRNLRFDLGRARAGVGGLFVHLPFLGGVALHGLDQVGN